MACGRRPLFRFLGPAACSPTSACAFGYAFGSKQIQLQPVHSKSRSIYTPLDTVPSGWICLEKLAEVGRQRALACMNLLVKEFCYLRTVNVTAAV